MDYIGRIDDDLNLVNKGYVDKNGILIKISSSDYENLSTAEKNDPNKYYFIYDMDPPVGVDKLSNLNDVDITTPTGNQGLVYNSTSNQWENKDVLLGFKLLNQSLTFSNLVATISDQRVTASTVAIVNFSDATLSDATSAGISVETSSGTITFTATTAPSNTLVCDIVCID